MEKAFEIKNLGNRLLKTLKAVAVPATNEVLDWTSESCALVNNAIVKGIGGVLVAVKPTIVGEVAKAVGVPVPAGAVLAANSAKDAVKA